MDGDFNRARWAGGPSLLNQRVCKISGGDRLDDGYLFYLLPQVLQKIADRTPFVTVKHLSAKDLREYEIPLPPLDEQKRIAGILDKADRLRRLRASALERLNTLGQSIFHEMFGELYSEERLRLCDLIQLGDKINYGVVQPGDEFEGGVRLLRAGDVLSPGLDPTTFRTVAPSVDEKHKKSRLKGDEVLIACVGSIGVVALAHNGLKGVNIARAVARVPLDAARSNRVFIAEQLKTQRVQNYFQQEIRVVAQPTLNIKQISEAEIFLPPLASQARFAEVMERLKLSVQSQEKHLAESEALFSSLQGHAFQGEL